LLPLLSGFAALALEHAVSWLRSLLRRPGAPAELNEPMSRMGVATLRLPPGDPTQSDPVHIGVLGRLSALIEELRDLP
jgi:hypothetical protein